MFLVASHYFTRSIIIDVMSAENGFRVVGAERIKLFQVVEELEEISLKSISASISMTALVCSGRICRET